VGTADIELEDAPDIAADAALIMESRRRGHGAPERRDRWSAVLTGGSFLVAAVGWVLFAPPESIPWPMLGWCVAAYVVTASVEFEIGPGCALPTAPVQVVMLFTLPPQLVPLTVLAGLAGAAWIAQFRDPDRREGMFLVAASGWQAVGPAAVFAIAGVTAPAWTDVPVYVLAFGAQFALDAVVSWVRNCYGLGVRARQVANALKFTFLCDLALAPVGLAAVLAAPDAPSALLLVLPPTLLLAMLQTDRRKHVDHVVALGAAYRRTSDLARRDALTGLSNRLAWEEAIEHFARSQTPIAVVLADVDGLKVANDTHGHDMGDRLLIAVGALLAAGAPATARDTDAFRIGGDEFAVLLPRAAAASMGNVVIALQSSFRAAPPLDGVVPISASFGCGYAATGADLGAAIAQADRGVNAEKTARGARRA
jgi:diguanylate cyclase (GGDEF)-like protein